MKNKLSVFIFLAFFMINACSDFIDVTPRGSQSLDNYFVTAKECETFINGLYKYLMQLEHWGNLNAPFLGNNMATDDAWMGNLEQDQSDHINAAFYVITPTSMGRCSSIYQQRYESISNCNYAIDRIAKSPIDEELKPYFIAQAKFCRAFHYYELLCNFGGMVLVTEPIGTSEMNKERSSAEETWQQIISDLKDAERDSPILTAKQASGRVSKGACQALLARAYLFKGDYQNAYNYANTVIQSGIYSLEPNFLDVWSIYNHNGVESIFEIQTVAETDKSIGNMLSTYTCGRGEKPEYFPSNSSADVMDGWGWCMPTTDLENCYLSESDEIRRRSTITRYGDPVYGDEVLNPAYIYNENYNKSHLTIRKFYLPIAERRRIAHVNRLGREAINFKVLRLAEMYLTRAEAAFFLNNSGQAADDMNFVRARVNLPPKLGLSGNDLIYSIWKERRMEFAFEGLRLYDLRRQIDPATGKPMIASVMGPSGSFVLYNTGPNANPIEAGFTKEASDKGKNFDIERHLLWPIPQGEIDRSQGIVKQNPNY